MAIDILSARMHSMRAVASDIIAVWSMAAAPPPRNAIRDAVTEKAVLNVSHYAINVVIRRRAAVATHLNT